MIDQNLVNYAREALKKGLPETDIRQALALNGWHESDINQALSLAKLGNDAPQAPMAFSPAQTQVIHKSPHFISPYSFLLAIVLFISLLILVNKIISDLQLHFSYEVNGRLVFDALLVVPFLVVAFVLHLSFMHRKEKFLILSYPYYIVSGWLILRLLWNVSQYILNSNATYGVYIVLIMVVAVLTGIIFFIQKFIRNKD